MLLSQTTDLDPVTMSPLLKQVTLQTDWAGRVIVWEHSPPDSNKNNRSVTLHKLVQQGTCISIISNFKDTLNKTRSSFTAPLISCVYKIKYYVLLNTWTQNTFSNFIVETHLSIFAVFCLLQQKQNYHTHQPELQYWRHNNRTTH